MSKLIHQLSPGSVANFLGGHVTPMNMTGFIPPANRIAGLDTSPVVCNWPFRIMCMSSMPASVTAADLGPQARERTAPWVMLWSLRVVH